MNHLTQTIRVPTMDKPLVKPRALYQAIDPSMTSSWLADGRGDLLHPTVIWRHDPEGWRRMSGVVEAAVARRWQRTWLAGGEVYALTPASRLSRVVDLPRI